MDCSLPGSSIHGIFPGKSTGVGCHCLLRFVQLNHFVFIHTMVITNRKLLNILLCLKEFIGKLIWWIKVNEGFIKYVTLSYSKQLQNSGKTQVLGIIVSDLLHFYTDCLMHLDTEQSLSRPWFPYLQKWTCLSKSLQVSRFKILIQNKKIIFMMTLIILLFTYDANIKKVINLNSVLEAWYHPYLPRIWWLILMIFHSSSIFAKDWVN